MRAALGRRLTRVERAAGIDYSGPPYRNPGPTANQVVYGSDTPGSWRLPGPHARHEVSIGGNIHDTVPKTDARSTAEVIAAMVAGRK
jgi:hypothetical protein